jgi:ABC-type multidrug transport system fused ATPase/permease subunit
MNKYKILHLDPDEHIILEVRKHWIIFAEQIISLILVVLMPIILVAVLKIFFPAVFSLLSNLSFKTATFFYVIWFLSFWLGFFVKWTKYFLDVWYVTEKRIIDVDQKAIFHREVSNLRFDKIQDVTVEVKGVLATALHFGNIKVQTASEDNTDFFMSFVKNPEEVKRVIFSQHNIVGDNSNNPNLEKDEDINI